jgi:hypothetical protein
MYYIVDDNELEGLANGTKRIGEVKKVENLALFSWSGMDVKEMISQFEPSEKKYNLEEVIKKVSEYLINYDIGLEVEECFKLAIRELDNNQEEQCRK